MCIIRGIGLRSFNLQARSPINKDNTVLSLTINDEISTFLDDKKKLIKHICNASQVKMIKHNLPKL